MKRKICLSISLLSFVVCLQAQKYQFQYQEKEQDEVQGLLIKKHFLGDEMANKMQLLKETYTYKIKNELNGIESIEVEKPSIYYSVNKINKFLKKGLKKGNITKEEAIQTLDNVLNIAINIRYQKTAELEKELWSLKDPVAVTSLFSEDITLY